MEHKTAIIAIILLSTALCGCLADSQYTVCAFLDDEYLRKQKQGNTAQVGDVYNPAKDGELDNEPGGLGEILADNKTIRCPENKDNKINFCYSLWLADPMDKTKISMRKQGCWDHPDRDVCNNVNDCVALKPPTHNNTHFCCCTGDMCNSNVTDGYIPPPVVPPSDDTPGIQILHNPKYKEKTIIVALVSVVSVAVVIAITYLAYRLWLGSQKETMESAAHLIEAPPTPTFELDQLKLVNLIERGRYGEVWRGTLNEMDVAVKLYAPHQKLYYLNEKDIYVLPHMDHDALPKFYGAEERIDPDGGYHYMIVMQFVTNGTLSHYLKENTIDWNIMCKMIHSAAAGMAHLHTDIVKGDKIKPAIAHRDFNTRNILVREDLSCIVCDYGFAMRIMGSKYVRNGQEENAEQSSLTDVGTLRYMAPEVLEGAVNLRDCEASLKQIDVYSLGLVVWEVASRCSDLYQGMPVPEYKLPYEAEIGVHPSFEEMQLLVSRNKTRPKFPDVWKDTNQAIRALKETIDDCWDHDAEARLTSLCVEERVLDMMMLWEARHKGVTPTINPMPSMGGHQDNSIVRNQTSHNYDTSHHLHTGAENADRNGNVPSSHYMDNPGMDISSSSVSSSRYSRPERSVSTSTTETTLSPSEPMDYNLSSKANRNVNYAKTNRVLQPHQGKNPTVERNTHKSSDEELAVLGNTLVDKSVAEAASHSDAKHGQTNQALTDELIEAFTDSLESSLVQNDLLSQQRSHPIPYVQNQVNLSEPLIVRPKQPNVPGNGTATHSRTAPPEPKQKSKLKFKKAKEKGKGLGLSFFGRNPFSSKSDQNSDDSGNYPTENLRNPAPAPQLAMLKKMSGHQRSRSDGGSNLSKSNLEPRHVPTEVCFMNGSAIVRPTSLPLKGQKGQGQSGKYNVDQVAAPSGAQPLENRLGIAEVGVAKPQTNCPANGQPAIMRSKQRSQSSIDLSPNGSSRSSTPGMNTLIDSSSKLHRPNSWQMGSQNCKNRIVQWNNHGNSDSNHNVIGSSDYGGENGLTKLVENTPQPNPPNSDKTKKRVKTATPKNGRFSLYDDRMMSQSIGDMAPGKQKRTTTTDPITKSSISLHQFGSIETDLNQFQAADFRC